MAAPANPIRDGSRAGRWRGQRMWTPTTWGSATPTTGRAQPTPSCSRRCGCHRPRCTSASSSATGRSTPGRTPTWHVRRCRHSCPGPAAARRHRRCHAWSWTTREPTSPATTPETPSAGIRTPQLDVPVATLSGLGQAGDSFCGLFGTTVPFTDEALAQRYPDHDTFVQAWDAALDEAVAAGAVPRRTPSACAASRRPPRSVGPRAADGRSRSAPIDGRRVFSGSMDLHQSTVQVAPEPMSSARSPGPLRPISSSTCAVTSSS